jgi:hypothetical protein
MLWAAMQGAAKAVPGTVYGKQQQVEAVHQALSQSIKPGDEIFLASQETSVRQELETLGAGIYSFTPRDQTGFETLLLKWLDRHCQQEGTPAGGKSYFVWTDDQAGTVTALGTAVRALIFFSSFEAIVPYEGSGTLATDKILLLLPREQLVRRYCEVKKLVDDRPVLVVVDVNEFPPLLGSYRLGNITWLASNETRVMHRADYEVKNLSVAQQFIMWSTNFADSWSFTNQEAAAFEEAIANITGQKGLILVDRNISLGSVASKHLMDCIGEQPFLQTSSFEQMCPRPAANPSP